MKTIECVQLSPEWFEARKGIPTASNFDRIITPKQMKMSAGADDLIAELIADRFRLAPPTDAEQRSGMSFAMRNGVTCEPEARRFYEMERNVDTRQVGLCLTDDGRFGCSPDALVGNDGILELKVPLGKTHVKYILEGKLPAEYAPQCHGSLIVTGREWLDFLSYCPGLPPLLVRVTPDKYTEALREALERFWDRYQETLAKFPKLTREAA